MFRRLFAVLEEAGVRLPASAPESIMAAVNGLIPLAVVGGPRSQALFFAIFREWLTSEAFLAVQISGGFHAELFISLIGDGICDGLGLPLGSVRFQGAGRSAEGICDIFNLFLARYRAKLFVLLDDIEYRLQGIARTRSLAEARAVTALIAAAYQRPDSRMQFTFGFERTPIDWLESETDTPLDSAYIVRLPRAG